MHDDDQSPEFCPDCIGDAQYLIGLSLAETASRQDYSPGFSPYNINWQIVDEDGRLMTSGYLHFNTMCTEVQHQTSGLEEDTVRTARHSYVNYEREMGLAQNDNRRAAISEHWDFTDLNGGQWFTREPSAGEAR